MPPRGDGDGGDDRLPPFSQRRNRGGNREGPRVAYRGPPQRGGGEWVRGQPPSATLQHTSRDGDSRASTSETAPAVQSKPREEKKEGEFIGLIVDQSTDGEELVVLSRSRRVRIQRPKEHKLRPGHWVRLQLNYETGTAEFRSRIESPLDVETVLHPDSHAFKLSLCAAFISPADPRFENSCWPSEKRTDDAVWTAELGWAADPNRKLAGNVQYSGMWFKVWVERSADSSILTVSRVENRARPGIQQGNAPWLCPTISQIMSIAGSSAPVTEKQMRQKLFSKAIVIGIVKHEPNGSSGFSASASSRQSSRMDGRFSRDDWNWGRSNRGGYGNSAYGSSAYGSSAYGSAAVTRSSKDTYMWSLRHGLMKIEYNLNFADLGAWVWFEGVDVADARHDLPKPCAVHSLAAACAVTRLRTRRYPEQEFRHFPIQVQVETRLGDLKADRFYNNQLGFVACKTGNFTRARNMVNQKMSSHAVSDHLLPMSEEERKDRESRIEDLLIRIWVGFNHDELKGKPNPKWKLIWEVQHFDFDDLIPPACGVELAELRGAFDNLVL